MSSIYAKVGDSFCQIGGTMPEGFIVMQDYRPEEGEWIASEDGTWIQGIPVQSKIYQLKKSLVELDEKSIRAIRAKLANTSTEEDDTIIAEIETEASRIRTELALIA